MYDCSKDKQVDDDIGKLETETQLDILNSKMSFDGGKNWYAIKEVKARVEYCEKLTETTH